MGQRPIVAVVSNALTPYRLALHRRIVRELPEIELWSLFTHGEGDSRWGARPPGDINPVEFGPGEPAVGIHGPRRPLHEWRKGRRVIRWLRDRGAAAVVVSGYNDPGRLRVLRWCHSHNVPVFLFGDSNVRDDDARARGGRGRLKRLLLPRVFRWCDGVLTCGSRGVEYFARYGVPRDRVFLFPYEPDYAAIAAVTPEQVGAARGRYGLDECRRFILFSGRLADQKRVDLLLDAYTAIASERPAWDLAIAGTGPDEGALRARAPAGLAPRVHWLGFIDDASTLIALYKACDVLVLPSWFEPWGVVVNEAVAAGLAVVASEAVGAAAELVRDGINGRVFPVGDVAALRECLGDVTSPGRCEQMKAAAAAVLGDWRRRADPVAGLAAALASRGIGKG
jgi:glycosyltransferase involved in cell wall biosynthesis